MHGPVLIVAERKETDKKVFADVDGFSLRNFPSLRLCVIDFKWMREFTPSRKGAQSKAANCAWNFVFAARARTGGFAGAGRIELR